MDITMKELNTPAEIAALNTVIAFIDEQLEAVGCPMKIQMQLELAAEEIFVNIASYAYAPGTGSALIRMGIADDPLTAVIIFTDSGVQYDPLAKEDPDIHMSAKERKIGGLGIFLTKKTMDEVTYEYKDGHNILTLKKRLSL